MTVAALLLIFSLTVADGHGVLFLVGAAGGLLSRLERSIRRTDVPLDYGASWTTLFLSPLLGALGSWIGIALIALLAHAKLLGELFTSVSWDEPFIPFTLATGAALGFSERFFDSLVNAVDQKATSDLEGKGGAGAGAAQVPAAPATKAVAAAVAGAVPGAVPGDVPAPAETQIASVSPDPLEADTLISVHGTGLDKDHIADIKLLNDAGGEVTLSHVRASGDLLQLVAPSDPGTYKLRLVLLGGQVIEHDLEIA